MSTDDDDALTWDGDEDLTASGAQQTVPKPDAAEPTDTSVTDDPDAAPRALPRGWRAVGKGSDDVAVLEDDGTLTDADEPQQLSTAMLVLMGIFGGIYLLYTLGWVIGGLKLAGIAIVWIPMVTFYIGFAIAVAAPALWMISVWILTRRSATWVRIVGLLVGAVLLVPWPFVMTGVFG